MTTIAYEVTGSGSLCAIARELVARGNDPTTPICWTRNRVPIFTKDKPLGWWAARMVEEARDGHRIQLVKMRAKPADKPATAATRPSDGSPYPEAPDGLPDGNLHGEGEE